MKTTEKTGSTRVDISACMEAAHMYNADYHRERHNYMPTAEGQETRVVSLGEYVLGYTVKIGTSLVGRVLMVWVLLAGALILANCIKNYNDVERAQPIYHEETHIDARTQKPFVSTWTEKSQFPLPDNYVQMNVRIYETLVLGLVLGCVASRFSLKRARKINVGIPLSNANTAHLPAADTLVRASAEPMQAQQNVLLRVALEGQKRHEEQLVRASSRQE